MKRFGVFVLAGLVLGLPPLAGAEDFDALVAQYEEIKNRAAKLKNPRSAAKQATPVLRKIGKLGTESALRFLVEELEEPRAPFANECARAVLTSGHARAAAFLLEDFGRKRPQVCRTVIDALEWAARPPEPARGEPAGDGSDDADRKKKTRPAKKAKKPRPPPLDLTTAEAELVTAARELRYPNLKPRMIPLLGRLRSVEAAETVLHLVSGAGVLADESRAAAVEALTALGAHEPVAAWLAGAAFRSAGKDPARLAIVAETAGRLRIEKARRALEALLLDRSEAVAAAAFEALSRLEKGIPSKAVRLAAAWLRRDLSPAMRARILDGLARTGTSSALAVVLKAARSGDTATRAIAMGSLAMVRESSAALEGILSGLKDPARDVRSTALRALRGVREKAIIGTLIDLLGRERESRLRIDALEILIKLTGHNMGPVAADWKKWWELEERIFEFPDRDAAGPTRVKARDLSYFGIEISSKRIAFLIDVSLSMLPIARSKKKSGEKLRKIDLLKRELGSVLRNLSIDTRINILAFDRSVKSWQKSLRSLSGGGLGSALEYVKKLGTGGGTNIFDSIELALGDPEVDTIYLLTDGQPTTGRYSTPDGIIAGTRELNRARGVTIHCIAFGAESDLLRKLAAEHAGEYRFVNE